MVSAGTDLRQMNVVDNEDARRLQLLRSVFGQWRSLLKGNFARLQGVTGPFLLGVSAACDLTGVASNYPPLRYAGRS